MKEINIVAEQARAIGLHVGLTHSNDKPKEKNNANEKAIQDEKPNKHRRRYYCGSSPSLQKAPHACDLSIKDVKGCSFKNHPLTSLMDRSHTCGAFCNDGEEPQ